jgi:hypothetical protein
MRKTKMIFGSLIVIAGASQVTSCKPANTENSGVKTLDNFAAGTTVSVNSCSGDVSESDGLLKKYWNQRIVINPNEATQLSAKAQEKYKDEVKKYLSAIPADVQKAFFNFGGQILLSSGGRDICSGKFSDSAAGQYLSENRRNIESCMTQASDPEKGTNMFIIHHYLDLKDENQNQGKENLKRIAHGGVRVFGLIYGQFFSKLIENPNDKQRASGVAFAFTNSDRMEWIHLKENLANRFIADMLIKKDPRFKLTNLESQQLGQGSAAKIEELFKKDSNANLLSAATFIFEDNPSKEQIEARKMQFQDFVLGESFDSANCSNTSRGVFKASFAETQKYYSANIVSAINATAKLVNNKLGPNEGVSLTDEKDVVRGRSTGISTVLGNSKSGTSYTTNPYATNPYVANPNAAGTIPTGTSQYANAAQTTNYAAMLSQLTPMLQKGAAQMAAACANCGGGNCSCGNGGSCSCASGNCSCANCSSGGCGCGCNTGGLPIAV